MKHAIIIAHPKTDSLTCAVAEAYEQRVRALGQDVVVRDLYRLGFDPCLKADEIPTPAGFRFGDDVVSERRLLADADVFAFFYPLWFNAPPAILKGYADRVFSMGFGYEPGLGGTEPLLDGKQLISFTSSGAPEQWVVETGAMQALMALFDRHLASMCGLRVLDHIHAGGIVSQMSDSAVADVFQHVREAVDRHFGDLARHFPDGRAPVRRSGRVSLLKG